MSGSQHGPAAWDYCLLVFLVATAHSNWFSKLWKDTTPQADMPPTCAVRCNRRVCTSFLQVSATSSRIIAILYGFLATVLINTCEFGRALGGGWLAGWPTAHRAHQHM